VDENYARILGFKGFKPVKYDGLAIKEKMSGERGFFSDNERCLAEILKIKKEVSTGEVLKLSKNIVLCRDCSDGNAVMNSAQKLMKKGYVASRFLKGRFYWSLIKNLPGPDF
jgi:hypothetical protein